MSMEYGCASIHKGLPKSVFCLEKKGHPKAREFTTELSCCFGRFSRLFALGPFWERSLGTVFGVPSPF